MGEMEPNNEAKLKLQTRLMALVREVAEERNFKIERLGEPFTDYYVEAQNAGDRCGDGRAVLEEYTKGGGSTGYTNENYKGSQIFGGTLGMIGLLRHVAKMDEASARVVISAVYKKYDIKMGNHIDDDHGRKQTVEELAERNAGCANQGEAAKGNMPMYKGMVDQQTVDSRYQYLQDHDASIPVLTGEHEEKRQALNLIPKMTFSTGKAVEEDNSIFNVDLAEIHRRAGLIYKHLQDEGISYTGSSEEGGFQDEFIHAAVLDCAQTYEALDKPKVFHIHADERVEI